METVLNMVIDPDNVRMLLLVVLGWSGHSLNKRIDELKHNDFANLNDTIQALTYALEKNGT